MGILDDNDPRIVHRLILPDGTTFVDEFSNPPRHDKPMDRDKLIALADGYRITQAAQAECTDSKCNVDIPHRAHDVTAYPVDAAAGQAECTDSRCRDIGIPHAAHKETRMFRGATARLPQMVAQRREQLAVIGSIETRVSRMYRAGVGSEAHKAMQAEENRIRSGMMDACGKVNRDMAQPGPAVVTIQPHPMAEPIDAANRSRCIAFFPPWPAAMDAHTSVKYHITVSAMCKSLVALRDGFDVVNAAKRFRASNEPAARYLHVKAKDTVIDMIETIYKGYLILATLRCCPSVAGLHYDAGFDAWQTPRIPDRTGSGHMLYAWCLGFPAILASPYGTNVQYGSPHGTDANCQFSDYDEAREYFLDAFDSWHFMRMDSSPSSFSRDWPVPF